MPDANNPTSEPMVLVPASALKQTLSNYGGYVATRCILCDAQGWEGQWQHKPECPVNNSKKGEVTESISVIRQIMEFIRLHASPGGFDPALAESRVNARLDKIAAALATQPAAPAEAKPFGYWHQGATDEESDFYLASESGNVACKDCVTLYVGPPAQAPAAPSVGDLIDAFEADYNGFHLSHQQMAEWFKKLRDATPPAAPAVSSAQTEELRYLGKVVDGVLSAEEAFVELSGRSAIEEACRLIDESDVTHEAPSGDRDAYEGAREDLLDWKKRALEAEALVRNFVREVNGQTFMGEPAPAATEAPSVPPEFDVRRILLEVVPGDGDGMEVYAKSVKDVEDLLGRMGEELEEWQLCMRRLPTPTTAAAVGASVQPVPESLSDALLGAANYIDVLGGDSTKYRIALAAGSSAAGVKP